MDEETKYWVLFSSFPGIGPLRFDLLLSYFGSAKTAWQASREKLTEIGLGNALTKKFIDFRSSCDIDAIIERLQTEQVFVVTKQNTKYPKLLREISDAPFVLYGKGKKPSKSLDFEKTIAVVGTRKMTNYGKAATRRIVEELVSYGFVVVSGLAYGVDSAAHTACLDAGGLTLAVLGCGVDIIAPPSSRGIYERIIDGNGFILSEMPLSLQPTKGLFPARNRIISGLSQGVVVVEGTEKSGSLITARYALDQGRDVFAIPGPITSSYSKASSILLKQGAMLVEHAQDIIDGLGLDTTSRLSSSEYTPESKEEEKVFDCLRMNPEHIDTIVRKTQLTSKEVSAILTILEMKGVVKDVGDKVYGVVGR